MPSGRRPTNEARSGGTEDFRHPQATRKNNPPAGIAPTYEVRERQVRTYAYDSHLDPQLVWAGKAEHTSVEVDVVSLHIHERISTRAILNAVRRPEPLNWTSSVRRRCPPTSRSSSTDTRWAGPTA